MAFSNDCAPRNNREETPAAAVRSGMRALRSTAALLLLGLAACAGTGPVIPSEQAVQFQQAGSPFPYNSFVCP
jgi:hypothetical protein